MSLRTDAFYRNLAEETLAKAGVTDPPIPVAELIRGLGVPLRPIGLPSWFSGAIVNEDGLPVVLLNAAISEDRQRRTLAHLLSHLVIVLTDTGEGYPRDTRQEHREAEAMAAEFLLPTSVVTEQARKWFNDYRYLARLFGVPESEMLERMRELGLVKVRGIYWDY